jgi:hypothetical protein
VGTAFRNKTLHVFHLLPSFRVASVNWLLLSARFAVVIAGPAEYLRGIP